MGGCRCTPCRAANTAYERCRKAARKAGDTNGITSAHRARQHMLRLSKRGVGRRAVQAATDIADSILSAIVTGAKKNIRERTERKILAVDASHASDHALVSSAATWRLIDELLEEQYTMEFIATELGYATNHVQFKRPPGLITVLNAERVRRLHERLTS